MYSLIKRIFDIIASGVALIVLAPVWIIAAIGILVSDPGPIFYFANRIGKDNRSFRMFKFRSMKVDKKADEKSLRPDQHRIFKWGHIMRQTKIDELPQLINVFIGDMSIIGPRPAARDQMAITRGGDYTVVSTVVPGLSSPAALYDYIYGDTIEDEKEYEEKVLPTRLALEVYYIYYHSIGYDAKMIWYTVVCICLRLIDKKPERIFNELLESAKEIDICNIRF